MSGLYAEAVDRRPTRRIHPSIGGDAASRIVEFRDGPQLLSGDLASLAEADAYPTMTYQQWLSGVVTERTEQRYVRQALNQARASHFAQ